MTDGQLLECFVRAHDPAAFEALVRRHGPMVLRVCQRLLRPGPDADDAFQATFIVLVRKAQSIAKLESVGSWLYGVAYRIALRARLRANRRLARERCLDDHPAAADRSANPVGEAADIRPVLDEELNRLPEKYRAPMVLCYLEGKSNDEAAQQLQCPTGTVKVRLLRARELLRNRLARRGLALSAGALALSLSQEMATAAVPQALAASAAQAATSGTLSASAGALADATLRAMSIVKLKVAAGAVVAACALTATVALLAHRGDDGPPLRPRATLAGHSDGVFAMAFFADGRGLATAGGDRVIRLWDTATGQTTGTLSGHRHKIESLAVSPDSAILASGEGDLHGPPGEVKLWDLKARRELATLPEHEQGVPGLAFDSKGRWLATASWGGTVRLWDVATRRLLHVLQSHQSGVSRLAFSPDGSLLASASNDRTVKLWDPARGAELATLRGHTEPVYALAFSPDGSTLASGSRGGTIRLWDVQSHEERLQIPATALLHCLTFAPDGRTLLSGHTEKVAGEEVGVLHLWEARGGQLRFSLPVHKLQVGCACFSPDGKLLATTSWDRTAKLWDVSAGSRAWAPGR
jgi:RNA polymerase sigma factor (sigma-70 family)